MEGKISHSSNVIERPRIFLRFLGRSVSTWVLGPAVGAVLALVIGARATNFFGGPDTYKIYVVGKLGSEDELRNSLTLYLMRLKRI